MKRIFKYTLGLIAAAAVAASCSTKSLDIPQQGVDGTDLYQTGDDTQLYQFLSAIYSTLHGDYTASSASFGGSGATCHLLFGTTLSSMADEDVNGFNYTEAADGSTYSAIWSYFYKLAYWCGMIVENVPQNTVASPAVRDRIVAEARAIRAYAMMNLVQLYGNPPLADHLLDGTEVNTPAAESWAFIEKELTEAAAGLPSKSGLGGQKSIGGRLTKEACYAILGKAQLWQEKYAEAANTLYNNVISTGKYALEADPDQLNLSNSDFCDENIWEFDFSNDPAYQDSQEGSFDAFAVAWPATMNGVNYPMFFMHYNIGSNTPKELYDFMKEHDGADSPRFKAWVCSYEEVAAEAMAFTFPVTNNQGYFKKKLQPRAQDIVGSNFMLKFSTKNQVYMRYAEVLLNFAEAACVSGTHTAEGLAALNLVRSRAGLDAAPALDMNNLAYGIKAERRIELYGENGIRFIDLVRWGDAPSVLAKTGTTSYTFQGVENGVYTVTTAATGGKGFQAGKNELFPIPDSDRNNNPDLVQNIGW